MVVKIFTDKHSVVTTAVWWPTRATLKKLFLAFFKKKTKKKRFKNKNNFTFISKALSFRKYFLNEAFLFKKKICFGNTFTFVFKLRSFRFENKNNLIFVSKHFRFANVF